MIFLKLFLELISSFKNLEFKDKMDKIFLLKLVKKIMFFYTSQTAIRLSVNIDKPVTFFLYDWKDVDIGCSY